jgi:hypothetical protein
MIISLVVFIAISVGLEDALEVGCPVPIDSE